MSLRSINENLLKENKYITQQHLDDNSKETIDLNDTKRFLESRGIFFEDKLLISGNLKILEDYPWKSLSPIVLSKIIHSNRDAFIYINKPTILVSIIEIDETIAPLIPPELVREILKINPIILGIIPDFKEHITEELLYELGYHTKFELQDMIDDLGDEVGLVALCHGRGTSLTISPCQITRFMSGPWTTCTVNSYSKLIPIYHDILKRKTLLEDEKNVYTQPFTREDLESSLPRYSEKTRKRIEHRLKLTEGMVSPWISTFNKGDFFIMKRFTNLSNEKIDGFKFLLIKGRTKTFNLFSIKNRWNMIEILNFVKGRRLVFLDYSCNGIDDVLNHLDYTTLNKFGGKRFKKKTAKNICMHYQKYTKCRQLHYLSKSNKKYKLYVSK